MKTNQRQPENYDFNEHIHRYGVWTSARAVQRGFTTTKNIKDAIVYSGLRERLVNLRQCNAEEFDLFHEQICEKIISKFEELNIECQYGRAAKILAIYIKTVIVFPNSGLCNVSKIAHPPIDSILLKTLSKKINRKHLGDIKWTRLERDNYFELIKELRELNLLSFWELEKYWEV